MTAAAYASRWCKYLCIFLLSGCALTQQTPAADSIKLPACPSQDELQHIIQFEDQEQIWRIRHLPQSRTIKSLSNPWSGGGMLYPFGRQHLLFSITVENKGNSALTLDPHHLALVTSQGDIHPLTAETLSQFWNKESLSSVQTQERSLAIADIWLNQLTRRTVLPGRTAQGLLAFKPSEKITAMRLKSASNHEIPICQYGLEIRAIP